MKTPSRISRRTILRGAGAAVALPLLEAMTPASARASAAASPLRAAFLYVPNGVHMADWTPSGVGRGFELSPVLEPLRAVKDDLLVLSGLSLGPARAQGDGGGDHARAMASFLTGRHPRKTDGADLQAGISIDQVAARAVGRSTRFPSLEIGCEGGKSAGQCDHGYSCAYQSNLSWRSETTPVTKEINPRLVFDRLFGTPSAGGDEVRALRDRHRKSILDHVAEDARQISGVLGAADRRKLDEYLTSVREIEQRISRSAPSRDAGLERYARPLGIPADYQEHLRLMGDLLCLAFRSDLTRVATFVFANDGSNRSYPSIGIPDGHHDLSHHGGDPARQAKVREINRFHAAQFAYLLAKLKATPDGDGSLLDHCLIVYGSGISDGNSHSHDGLPVLLAGAGGGTVKTGRHVQYPKETPLMNLYLSILDRLGTPLESFGDSTGRLASLDG